MILHTIARGFIAVTGTIAEDGTMHGHGTTPGRSLCDEGSPV